MHAPYFALPQVHPHIDPTLSTPTLEFRTIIIRYGSSMVRFLPSLAALLVAVVVTWNIARRSAPQAPAPQSPTPQHSPTTADTPLRLPSAATTPTARSGFRLAGTVVGDLRYAIIEAPNGSNELYGIGQSIPGIGKLVEVGARSATIEGDDGRFVMKLLAAPTPTTGLAAPEPFEADAGFVDDFDEDYDEGLEADYFDDYEGDDLEQ